MNPDVRKAIDVVRNTLDAQCRDFEPADYKAVLEELIADMEGHLDAINDKNPELFD